MKYIGITSILALSLTLPVKAGAQAQPAAAAPQAPAAPHAEPAVPPLPPAPVEVQTQPQGLQTLGGPPAAAITDAVPEEKSPATALTGTLVGTGLGIGLLAGGIAGNQGELSMMGLIALTVGPSFGYFYTGETGRGMAHIGVRAGSLGVMAVGMTLASFDALGCAWDAEEACELSTASRATLIGGALLGAGSIAYSIYDAPRSVRRYNARHRQLMLMPMPMTGPDHSSGLGLQLGGTF